ncbi:hypothetical protein MPLDJ20_220022 [Mesorhizobium plurifarium]|uniref:Uncharacterized protein n=1 Tax=Mesorhizobium plurifarium TaxID=69974 RepID=A0A090F2S4_MESPL|nr:hypothetical protein MPLDJ20_220022 [Mesorhizobium plurifarium]
MRLPFRCCWSARRARSLGLPLGGDSSQTQANERGISLSRQLGRHLGQCAHSTIYAIRSHFVQVSLAAYRNFFHSHTSLCHSSWMRTAS